MVLRKWTLKAFAMLVLCFLVPIFLLALMVAFITLLLLWALRRLLSGEDSPTPEI
jgi:membrane protein implicated in regulation of membrane protease activity